MKVPRRLTIAYPTKIPIKQVTTATTKARLKVFLIAESICGFLSIPAGILKNPQILSAIKNTFSLAFVVAVVTCLMGILVGYAIVKRRGTFISKCLDQISFLPYLIPSIALGATLLAMFAVPRGPIPSLHGSFLLLVIVCSISALPYAVKAGISAMRQIGGSSRRPP